MEIKIQKLTEKFELATQYSGQSSPQGVYIELDTETGEMSAESNHEIGNAVLIADEFSRIHYEPISA